MIENLYIVLFAAAVIMFFISLFNILRLERSQRLLMMIITLIMFVALVLEGFNIEKTLCTYTTTWLCNTVSRQEVSFVAINLLLLVITVLYILFDFLGLIPDSQKGKVVGEGEGFQ